MIQIAFHLAGRRVHDLAELRPGGHLQAGDQRHEELIRFRVAHDEHLRCSQNVRTKRAAKVRTSWPFSTWKCRRRSTVWPLNRCSGIWRILRASAAPSSRQRGPRRPRRRPGDVPLVECSERPGQQPLLRRVAKRSRRLARCRGSAAAGRAGTGRRTAPARCRGRRGLGIGVAKKPASIPRRARRTRSTGRCSAAGRPGRRTGRRRPRSLPRLGGMTLT